jgi:enoyl-CoA hydratase/carnithine racemase
MTAIRFTRKLIPSCRGNLGILELNNPRPLHALTLDMIHCMSDVWTEWSDIRAILIKSSSTDLKVPAFCAGGDVKSVCQSGLSEPGNHGYGIPGLETADFFRDEYRLNYRMAMATSSSSSLQVPQISLWNGLVMGGGVGISIHGKYRVATENSILAMPETAIGFFCDVGSTWWMPRKLSIPLANYLALTGSRLFPSDLLYTGLATHYTPSNQLNELETALVHATEQPQDDDSTKRDIIAPILMKFHHPISLDDSFLAQNRSFIEETFQETSVEAIVNNLEAMKNTFSQQTLKTLARMSPTSLKVTLEALRRGSSECKTIGDALAMEFRMSQVFMRPKSDFYEGIRAMLIDKDQSPKWNPRTLQDVTPDIVESYFAPLTDEYEWTPTELELRSQL